VAATCQERAILQASVAALRSDRDLNTPTSNLTAIGLQRRGQSENPSPLHPTEWAIGEIGSPAAKPNSARQ
jgi:hypothetical protein